MILFQTNISRYRSQNQYSDTSVFIFGAFQNRHCKFFARPIQYIGLLHSTILEYVMMIFLRTVTQVQVTQLVSVLPGRQQHPSSCPIPFQAVFVFFLIYQAIYKMKFQLIAVEYIVLQFIKGNFNPETQFLGERGGDLYFFLPLSMKQCSNKTICSNRLT